MSGIKYYSGIAICLAVIGFVADSVTTYLWFVVGGPTAAEMNCVIGASVTQHGALGVLLASFELLVGSGILAGVAALLFKRLLGPHFRGRITWEMAAAVGLGTLGTLKIAAAATNLVGLALLLVGVV